MVDTINAGVLPKDCTIVEIGAHHGYLLADMIQFIYTLQPELLNTLHFAIVEKFPHLKKQQQKYFKDSFGDAVQLTHYSDISEVKLDSAFIVANEIFDAFACELIYTTDTGIKQNLHIHDHKLSLETCTDEYLLNICKRYAISKGEISLGFEDFAQTLYTNIKKFIFVTFDYGEKYPVMTSQHEFTINTKFIPFLKRI